MSHSLRNLASIINHKICYEKIYLAFFFISILNFCLISPAFGSLLQIFLTTTSTWPFLFKCTEPSFIVPLLRGFVSVKFLYKLHLCNFYSPCTQSRVMAEDWTCVSRNSKWSVSCGLGIVGWERSPSPELATHHGIPTQNHRSVFKSNWSSLGLQSKVREFRFYPGFAFS